MNDAAINPMIIETGWLLVHFTWQAALLGIAHKLLLQQRWAATPQVRYRISLAMLLLLVTLPVLTAVQLSPAGTVGESDAGGIPPVTEVMEMTERPIRAHPAATPSMEAQIMPWLVGAWLAGVMGYALRFLLGFIGLRRIIRNSSTATLPAWLLAELDDLRHSLGISQRVRLAASTMIESPMVTGWLVPTILLPVCATTRLTPGQLRMTLLHELAHVQRLDYLVNLLQVVVETLFFFHPVAHQVSRSLRLEREKCCDDIVIRHCGNHLGYARLLTELETLRQPLAAEWSLGITAGNAQGELTSRVLRITGLAEQVPAPRLNWSMLLPLLLIAILLGVRTTLPTPADRIRYSIALPVAEPTVLPEPITAGDSDEIQSPESEGKFGNIPPVAANKTTSITRPQSVKKDSYKKQDQPTATTTATTPRAGELAMAAASTSQAGGNGTTVTESAVLAAPAPEPEPKISGGRLLSAVQPEYPRYALQHGVSGKVTLGFTVGTDGRVSNIKVLAAEPRRVFDSAAIEALRQWRFEPFTMNGQPVAHEVRQTLDFSPRSSAGDGMLRDCNTLTGSRLCRNNPVQGANVVNYTGDTTVGY